jgi:hypothetical protein
MDRQAPAAILILDSIHHVLRAEKVLEAKGLVFDLVPVPKEVNPDCGMALWVALPHLDSVVAALGEAGIEIQARYRRREGRFEPWGS